MSLVWFWFGSGLSLIFDKKIKQGVRSVQSFLSCTRLIGVGLVSNTIELCVVFLHYCPCPAEQDSLICHVSGFAAVLFDANVLKVPFTFSSLVVSNHFWLVKRYKS